MRLQDLKRRRMRLCVLCIVLALLLVAAKAVLLAVLPGDRQLPEALYRLIHISLTFSALFSVISATLASPQSVYDRGSMLIFGLIHGWIAFFFAAIGVAVLTESPGMPWLAVVFLLAAAVFAFMVAESIQCRRRLRQ